MIRVVLDTNVLVSAVLTRGGAEAHALDLAAVRKIQIYATPDIRSGASVRRRLMALLT
jgi:predicted nucleic acid-binding protein